MKDKNNIEIEVGQTVIVPDPERADIWQHSFQATVADIVGETVIVADADSDFFEVDGKRLEVYTESMKSKKKLFEFLSQRFSQDVNLANVGNETYGKQSMIYLWNVHTRFKIDRQVLEAELADQGFKVKPHYCPGTQHIEIQVSYFKGQHWDE